MVWFICGPKTSICCTILSIWGIIMLGLMAIFLKLRSIAFAEDILPELEPDQFRELNISSTNDYLKYAEGKYDQACQTCWIAACLYFVTLVISVFAIFRNKQVSS